MATASAPDSGPAGGRPCGRSRLAIRRRKLSWTIWTRSIAASEESLEAGLRAAEDQGMDVVRTLVNVARLEVNHVSHYVIFLRDAARLQLFLCVVARQVADHPLRVGQLVLEQEGA